MVTSTDIESLSNFLLAEKLANDKFSIEEIVKVIDDMEDMSKSKSKELMNEIKSDGLNSSGDSERVRQCDKRECEPMLRKDDHRSCKTSTLGDRNSVGQQSLGDRNSVVQQSLGGRPSVAAQQERQTDRITAMTNFNKNDLNRGVKLSFKTDQENEGKHEEVKNQDILDEATKYSLGLIQKPVTDAEIGLVQELENLDKLLNEKLGKLAL